MNDPLIAPVTCALMPVDLREKGPKPFTLPGEPLVLFLDVRVRVVCYEFGQSLNIRSNPLRHGAAIFSAAQRA